MAPPKNPTQPKYHSIIIGAGSGGLTVAVGLSGFGKRVALVERGPVGGDCTNVGCIPSKTLLHAVASPQGRSPAQILAHVRERRNHLRDEEATWVRDLDKVDFITGEARFVDDHTLAVQQDNDRLELRAKHIIIAAGSSPRVIPIPGLAADKLLTNERLFALEDAPEHLVIVGGGVIATEMAFAFRGLGSQVTMIELADRLLSVFSEDVSAVIRQALETKGVTIHTGVRAERVEGGALVLSDGSRIDNVSYVLQAIGRVPNLDTLGLEHTSLDYDDKGIPTNAYGATNVPSIHAIGDITTGANFTHAANAQGRRLVTRLSLPFLPRVASKPDYPSVTFSQPEVAQAGPLPKALAQRYHPALITVHRYDLADTDRGYTMGLSQGFVKLYAMRLSGRLLAAEIVAPHAGEMISLLTFAISKGQRLYALSGLIYPYPILSEAVKKAADNFVFGTLPKLPRELGVYLRYRWRSLPGVDWLAKQLTALTR